MVIPKEKLKKKKKKWMTEEILKLIKRRDGREYRILDKDMINRCKQAKDKWFNEKCTEIETLQNIET